MLLSHGNDVATAWLQIARVVKAAMVPLQAAVYNWVKQTGTLRMDPQAATVGKVQRDYPHSEQQGYGATQGVSCCYCCCCTGPAHR